MGKLLDLLKATASEASLFSKLGKWRQAVSSILDDAGFPDYAEGYSGAQNGVAANSDLNIDTAGFLRGITFSTGAFTLKPGKTYLLRAEGRFTTFSDPVGGILTIRWVDAGNTAIGFSGAYVIPTTNTGNISNKPIIESVYQIPPVPASPNELTVHLRCTAGTGNANMGPTDWQVVIQEIPGGV